MTDEDLLSYERLVYSIVKKYSHFYDIEDLKQVGMIGLQKAFMNYKEGFDAQFSTYAYFSIRGEVLKFIREDKTIKVSRELQKVASSIDRAKEVLMHKLQRIPSTDELSLFLEIPESTIIEAERSKEFVLSLHYALNEDEDKEITFSDMVPYEEKGYNAEILDLKQSLRELPEEERQLIHYRYFADMTQDETSKVMGINQARVSRSEKKILQKLKTNLVA